MGRLKTAADYLNAALQWAREAGDDVAVVDCYVGLTTLLPRTLSAETADQILGVALPLAEQLADPAAITSLLCNCAACHMYAGNIEQADKLLRMAAQRLQTNGDVPDVSPSVEYNLGFVAHLRGDLTNAEKHWLRALQISEEDGVLSVRAECIAALGNLAFRRGKLKKARTLAAEALRLARRAQFLTDERLGLAQLIAKLRHKRGHGLKAKRELVNTASAAKESDIPLCLGTLLTLYKLLVTEGQAAEALSAAEELRTVARARGATWWIEQADSVGGRAVTRHTT